MQRLGVRQARESPALAPLRKTAGRFVMGQPRVLVADIGGEEAEEPLRCFFIRQEQRRKLRGQARECAGFFEPRSCSYFR